MKLPYLLSGIIPLVFFLFQAHPACAEENKICSDCNVIFISLTNVRPDHLDFYGYFRNTSPVLDRLAKKSIVFENAYSVASWTLPATMSIYTSQYPFDHGVVFRDDKDFQPVALPNQTLTLVDLLNQRQYETASINAGQDYFSSHGLTSRFKFEHSFTGDPNSIWWQYGSIADVIPESIKWIEENKNKKFFLHIQGYDAHCPFSYPRENAMFDPKFQSDIDFATCYWTFEKTKPITLVEKGKPQKYYLVKSDGSTQNVFQDLDDGSFVEKTRTNKFVAQRLSERELEHMIALYDGEIFNSDQQVGKFIQYLDKEGLLSKTIIFFFSEHGDMFGKYGRIMRGGPLRGTFYNDVLHVPFFIYNPKLSAKRIKSSVSVIDFAPTVLDMLGIEVPTDFRGQSAVSLLTKDNRHDPIFAGSVYIPASAAYRYDTPTIIRSVQADNFKLIKETIFYNSENRETLYELFDLKKDPRELNDISMKDLNKLEELNNLLDGWAGPALKKYVPEIQKSLKLPD